ncbi:MAG: response regulator [Clostridiales Family XIII bacterium]|jgi:signal transduction histidine kinase/CheY-like chemotaxis protein|nr:response regulator [Clostridiales Family XIII bacterium]
MLRKMKQYLHLYIFSKDTPLNGRLFNVALSFGFAGSLIGWASTLVQASSLASILSTALLPLIILALLLLINRTKNYRLGGLLVALVFCDIGFPIVFFMSGGIRSGMLAYMLLGAVIICILLNGKDVLIMLSVYLATCVACFFAQYAEWVSVTPIATEALLYTDVAVAFVVSGILIGLVLKYQQREYENAWREAEAASKSKSDFLSNMSHEMRTPMNAIIGMTAIAKSTCDPARKDDCLDKIENASVHLLGVINDILDMSKIEANKLELSFVEFDFEKLLQKAADVINFRVEDKRQNFTVFIDKNVPRNLIGDDQRLTQVITNLLSNAVKFTPEGGSVRLDAKLLKAEGDTRRVLVKVRDTGIGISDEQQANLFRSFQQAESSTSRKFGGTGLGLAISKRIVELMGGRIWVESEPGKGASFIFTFLMRCGQEEEHAPINAGRGGPRILAVDGEREIREYLQQITQSMGAVCDLAADAAEAVALIERNGPYDICFADRRIRDAGGGPLSRRVKLYGEDCSVVSMISSADRTVVEADEKQAGVDRFLAKPIFPFAVSDCVHECCGDAVARAADSVGERKTDDFGGYRILLAEDVEINREIVLALLEPTRLDIACAENGAAAVEMFGASPDAYDMIFMDLQMPEVDGYEATRRIRALDIPKANDIPIIAMTANVFREDVEKCLEAGMNGHLGKPLDFDEVLQKLREHLPKTTIDDLQDRRAL